MNANRQNVSDYSYSPLRLQLGDILKYSWPSEKIVKNAELDKHIRYDLATASFSRSMSIATVGFIVCLALYFFHVINVPVYRTYWLILLCATYIFSWGAYCYIRDQIHNKTITLRKTYGAMLLPSISSALVWGFLLTSFEDKSTLLFGMCFLAASVGAFINTNWSRGLPYLGIFSITFAIFPFLVDLYVSDLHFSKMTFISAAFLITVWVSAYDQAASIIEKSVQDHQHFLQSRLIENLLNEFQINSTDWVWETDVLHHLTFTSLDNINELSATPSDTDTDRYTGKNIVDIFDHNDANTTSLSRYLSMQQGFDQLIVKFKKKDPNHTQSWELRGHPILDEKGAFLGFRGFGRDVTDLQTLNELKHSKEKFDMMSKFVAKIAHDFNNSLMVIQSSAEIISLGKKHKLSAEDAKIIDSIKDVVHSASRVNKELLSFARQEVLQPKAIELREVLTTISQHYILHAPDVKFELAPSKPIFANVDKYALQRTLENLIVNGIESMNKQGTITMKVHYSDEGRGRRVKLRIEDTGTGYSAEALQNASEPFYTTKKHIGGSGLGMATAAGFAQQSRGCLHWGNLNVGAFVELVLPAADHVKLSPNHKISNHIDIRNFRVLIVDDDLQVLTSLSRWFSEQGSDVTSANSINDAIDIADKSSITFDILLCDFKFENESWHGAQLAERIKYRCKAVILMTGYSEIADELSSYTVLTKPFSKTEFMETLDSITAKQTDILTTSA